MLRSRASQGHGLHADRFGSRDQVMFFGFLNSFFDDFHQLRALLETRIIDNIS